MRDRYCLVLIADDIKRKFDATFGTSICTFTFFLIFIVPNTRRIHWQQPEAKNGKKGNNWDKRS